METRAPRFISIVHEVKRLIALSCLDIYLLTCPEAAPSVTRHGALQKDGNTSLRKSAYCRLAPRTSCCLLRLATDLFVCCDLLGDVSARRLPVASIRVRWLAKAKEEVERHLVWYGRPSVVAKRQTRRTWPVSWRCHETFIFRAGTFSFRAKPRCFL